MSGTYVNSDGGQLFGIDYDSSCVSLFPPGATVVPIKKYIFKDAIASI